MSDDISASEVDNNQQNFKDDSKKIASAAGIFIGGGMLGRAFLVVGQVFMARVLTLEAFGLYSLGWTILRIMATLTALGMHVGVVRLGTPFYKKQDYSGLKNIIFQTFTISFFSSSLISALIFVFAGWISVEVFHDPDFEPVLRMFVVAIPFAALLTIAGATTRLTKYTRYDVLSQQLGRPAVHLFLMFVFYFLGWGLLGLTGAAVLSFILAVILSLYYVFKLFPEVIRAKRTAGFFNRELLMLSVPATMLGTVNFINSRIDRLMLGYFGAAEDVGIYQAISQIVIVFTIVQMAFTSILSPMIADYYQAGENDRLQQIYWLGTKWALYICLPIFALIMILPNELIIVLFGAKFAENSMVLIVLAIGELFNVSTGAVGAVMYMTGRERRYLVISLVAFTTNIILNILLIPIWDITGAAVATSMGTVVLFGLGIIDMKRFLNISTYNRRFLKGFVAISLATGTGYGLTFVLDNIAPFIELSVIGSVIGIIYLILLRAFGLDEEDTIFLKAVSKRIRKMLRRSKPIQG